MTSNKELAKAILDAAGARENSFDHGTAARLQASGQVADLDKLYALTIRQAAELDGCNPFLSFPVYLLLTNCWNDAIDWALCQADKPD